MVIRRGEIWWADLDDPRGSEPGYRRPILSEPGYRRPILIVSSDRVNLSGLQTVIAVAISSRIDRVPTRHHLPLPARVTGLPHDSVAFIASVEQVNKDSLRDRNSILPRSLMSTVGKVLADVLDIDP